MEDGAETRKVAGAKERLRHSELLHRTLTANVPDASMFLIDRDLRILIAEGEGVRRLPWMDEDLFRGRAIADLDRELPAEILSEAIDSCQAALAGERREFEFTSAGLTYEVTAVPVPGQGDDVQSVLAVVRDVTARRAAETDRARLAGIVSGSDDAIHASDLDGQITDWNDSATRLYGYEPETAIGRPAAMLVPPERHDDHLMLLRRVHNGERVGHFETERVRRDGSRLPVWVSLSAVRGAGGATIGAATIARELRDRPA